jgi:hypothetical protein
MIETFETYKPDKSLWTEVDFDNMNWHDSFIYALSLGERNELTFDIDYIFKWINPSGERKNFKYWVSPCTLVFENVYDLKFDIEVSEPFRLEIANIYFNNPQRPKNADYIKRNIEYDWTVETNQGEITFKSIGYKQFVRQTPVLLDEQKIQIETRNGISFDRPMTSESNSKN